MTLLHYYTGYTTKTTILLWTGLYSLNYYTTIGRQLYYYTTLRRLTATIDDKDNDNEHDNDKINTLHYTQTTTNCYIAQHYACHLQLDGGLHFHNTFAFDAVNNNNITCHGNLQATTIGVYAYNHNLNYNHD